MPDGCTATAAPLREESVHQEEDGLVQRAQPRPSPNEATPINKAVTLIAAEESRPDPVAWSVAKPLDPT